MFRQLLNNRKKPEPAKSALDKDTLSLIQKAYNIGENGKEIDGEETDREVLILPDESAKRLELLIQNARNTKEFYDYIYEISPRTDKEILNILIRNTLSIKDFLSDLYIKKLNISYLPDQKKIMRGFGYKKALKMAIYEENKALDSYIAYFKEIGYGDIILEQVVYLKMCNINFLTVLLQ